MTHRKLEDEIPSDLRSEVLDAVFRVSRSPMVLLDTEGRIIRFSGGCSEATGYSAAEAVGRPIWDLLIPADEREDVMRIFRELSHGSLPNTHENDWLTRTDERIRLAWSNSPILGPGGEVAYILGTGINVSEQRRIEAALQQSESLRESEKVRHEVEARLAAVVTISADAIISCDAEQRITFFNGGAEKFFGWTAEEVKGRPLGILLPEPLRPLHRQHVDDFATAPESSHRMGDRREIMGLRRTGETFPAEASISSRTDVDGEPICTVVLRDLTERRALEKALRDREFRQRVLADAGRDLSATLNFEQTLQSIADLAVRTIANHCIIDVLEAGEATRLVVAPQDPAKKEIAEFLCRVALDRTRPHLVSSVHESARPILVEEVSKECLDELAEGEAYGRLLGALAPRSILAVPLIARSQLLGVILLISAEPGRRYGPSDLELAVELADRAALALDNARLYQKAQRAIALREDMISFVSHDLRNPLYSAGLMLDILARNAKADEAGVQAGSCILEIRRVIAEMSHLIGDLLDVSLIEAGSLRLDRGIHSVQRLLEEALATMRPLADKRQILLELSVDPDVAPVHADADRTLQIVHNLVGNALKFTPTGGHVIVSAANVDAGVRFSVQDTGPGIEPHTLDNLFDRYWQAGRTGTAGVGLGLAIVEGIVCAHGGSIEVESSEGEGSTFHVVLPRADAVPPDDRGCTRC